MNKSDNSLSLGSTPMRRYGRPRRSHRFYALDPVLIDKSPKESSPIKASSPIFNDYMAECNKLEDLGAKVANNFKANKQRGLDDSIKRRKFFKSAVNSNNVQETNSLVDVNKVLKLIAPKPSEVTSDQIADAKSSLKTALKTYSNKRKRLDSDNNVTLESFALPDEPIVPLKAPRKIPKLNKKIDIVTSENVDVNLEQTWKLDEAASANANNTSQETTNQQENQDVEFKLGELVWAKVGKYPFWPCMIAEEPSTGQYYKALPKRLKLSYHVRFFDENGTRSWVTGSKIISYTTKDDYERISNEYCIANVLPVKKGKEFFRVKGQHVKPWAVAVQQAEELKIKSVEERINYFNELLSSPKRKRRASSSFERIQQEQKMIERKIAKALVKKPAKELSEKTIEARKRLRSSNVGLAEEIKQEREDSPLPFPLLLPSEIKTEIEDGEISENSRPVEMKIELSDTASNLSDKTPSEPATLDSQSALIKRNNIMRGAAREKYCHVCEKPGSVVKCKGYCHGFYHRSCAALMPRTKRAENETNVEIVVKSEKSKPLSPKVHKTHDLKDMQLADKIDFEMRELMKGCNDSYYGEIDLTSDEEQEVQQPKELPVKKSPVFIHVTADECIKDDAPDDNSQLDDFKCALCSENEEPICQMCLKPTPDQLVQKCSWKRCEKFFHSDCLKKWPQSQRSQTEKNAEAFICPSHVCYTCFYDKPNDPSGRYTNERVIKCLRCPSTYHCSALCVPAGTKILTFSQCICPRHLNSEPVETLQTKSKKKNYEATVNANWCFICAEGGNLVCCETCPTSVHLECMEDEFNADERFYCIYCQSGRFPCYDEVVWVKFARFRWWPALILFPNEVPDRVELMPHGEGEFAVRFFGSHDHCWIGRGRTFLFQEEDSVASSTSVKKRMDRGFVRAIQEATAAYKLKKEFKLASRNEELKPPPYVQIKSNKPVGKVRQFDGNISVQTPCNCDPNDAFPCGPDSNCLNRLLMTECSPDVCPAGERCQNQSFEKREYPPLRPYLTNGRGWGLKTMVPIRQGDFVIEYVGEMINEREYQRRLVRMREENEENYYFLTIDRDHMLDAGKKGNAARFMNHSCEPNCKTQKWTVNGNTRVGLFAICDIAADTELTFNYNLECNGKEKKVCRCSAPNCVGFIGVKTKTSEPSKKSASKSKVKPLPAPIEANNTNPCFICSKLGDVGACSNKNCKKYYHLECVDLTEWPKEKWNCPWHQCNFCSKRTTRCCMMCINSYCPPHSSGNVRYDKLLLGFVCAEHDSKKQNQNEETKDSSVVKASQSQT